MFERLQVILFLNWPKCSSVFFSFSALNKGKLCTWLKKCDRIFFETEPGPEYLDQPVCPEERLGKRNSFTPTQFASQQNYDRYSPLSPYPTV